MTTHTADELRKAEFKGPVAFYDGAKGMARQEWECTLDPRFRYAWERSDRKDKGRQFYLVDGNEVKDFDEAARLLSLPADPESPQERIKRDLDEFRKSPKVGGATRALSEARCNGDAGPFATVRAWMRRADNGWHQGLNSYSESERANDRAFPHWLYNIKSAAHETYRGMYLLAQDRKSDIDLKCAFGTRCRDCPILKTVEASMVAARTRSVFPQSVEDEDIDAAKVWTCIGHVLTDKKHFLDGAIFSTKDDKDWF